MKLDCFEVFLDDLHPSYGRVIRLWNTVVGGDDYCHYRDRAKRWKPSFLQSIQENAPIFRRREWWDIVQLYPQAFENVSRWIRRKRVCKILEVHGPCRCMVAGYLKNEIFQRGTEASRMRLLEKSAQCVG